MPEIVKILNNFLSVVFSQTTCILNFYLLFSIFYSKRIAWKSELSLIYIRFAFDMFYTFFVPHNKIYYIIRQIFPGCVVKNLSFYLIWPTIPLGCIRATLVFLITLDRVIALFFPISYHNHRFKISLSAIIISVSCFGASDHLILFGYCRYTVDVPLECDNFNCVIKSCFYSYWVSRDQIQYILTGTFSVILLFRLVIWNNFVASQRSQNLSRATRIALLESIVIICFSIIPSLIFASFPSLNFASVGPWTIVLKHAGFMIEALIICQFLLKRKSKNAIGRNSNVLTAWSQ
uniref:SRBC-64 n=1 Tax=Caenorhabditis elegans TaxID=6239 RepID=G5EEB2_CAEEL|nr:SRBC-64 [Caenorhabditis elegans]ABX82994.1 SRBC-64 [Caenorhabditis elegans]ABX82996.1 SRBC-64 [Caenorhabditis elegans]ABX82999.1 SRBC-64 [Caenorhabditis elegans]ABX83000.1 SRBC-64 [Caenorhabditis elegans]